jgi:hypothetical protein
LQRPGIDPNLRAPIKRAIEMRTSVGALTALLADPRVDVSDLFEKEHGMTDVALKLILSCPRVLINHVVILNNRPIGAFIVG